MWRSVSLCVTVFDVKFPGRIPFGLAGATLFNLSRSDVFFSYVWPAVFLRGIFSQVWREVLRSGPRASLSSSSDPSLARYFSIFGEVFFLGVGALLTQTMDFMCSTWVQC